MDGHEPAPPEAAGSARLIDRCADRGWIRRVPGRDRRTVALQLTHRGTELVDEILAARSDALGLMLEELSCAERGDLERLLARITARLADDRPAATHVCRLCDRDVCASGPGCPLEHTVVPGGPRPRRRRSTGS